MCLYNVQLSWRGLKLIAYACEMSAGKLSGKRIDRIAVQNYKSPRIAAMVCATLINSNTQTCTDRQLAIGSVILLAHPAELKHTRKIEYRGPCWTQSMECSTSRTPT